MKYRFILLAFIVISCFITTAKAQQTLEQNKLYNGAFAKKQVYKAIYQLDNGSPEIIKKTIRNINNLLKDPRLKGKLQIELVAFSGGTEAYRKGSEYEEAIKGLIQQGVIVAQCLNTLQERKIDKSELYDFLAYVPTGNGELLIRANEGWTIIKP
ncbi:DsrE family protein [Sphingobacterium chuzhouense]|uniref:DsrE family protein n=1 Tax=Sphingobacterium chuzhouense TaxID=1742264 RepID=A0ABR7XQ39_9SPHI|nr:DsrE family protein [Sphingobacterium chuzhouense]MBD1421288.1 DsrE family protein [Sphingobacterium chuzhouense]